MRDYRYYKRWTAVLLLTGTAVAAAVGMAGCKPKVPAVSPTAEVSTEGTGPAEQPSEPESRPQKTENRYEKDLGTAVEGTAGTMVESASSLFFKYDNYRDKASSGAIWRIDKETEKMENVYTFKSGETNSLFWYLNGSLYFDIAPSPGSASTDRIGLYRMDMRTGESKRLFDLTALPTALYASDGILYVRGYGMELYYELEEDGSLGEELRRENTVYAKVPAGGEDLYRVSVPAVAVESGYLAYQKDGVLTLSDPDGKNERKVEDVTNFSNILCEKDSIFAVVDTGEKRQIVRIDPDSLKPTILREFDEAPLDYPTLLQYADGRVYYMVNDMESSFGTDRYFYSVDGSSGQDKPQMNGLLEEEPGASGFYGYYGNFYVCDGFIYREKLKDYGVYIEKAPVGGADAGARLLESAMYQSRIGELGHVEAQEKQIPCACGEKTAARYYVENLVIDGDSDAVKAMNRVLQEAAERQIRYGESLADPADEAWVHDESFSMPTLQYQIADVTYLDSRYCCIEAVGNEYTGGVHGMPFREFFIFDRQTGRALKLEDIIATPVEQLKKIVAGHFRVYAEQTQATFETPEELEQTVAARVNYEFPCYLSDEGVSFYFSPYDIAPYAAGFPEVTVPYGELELKVRIGGK